MAKIKEHVTITGDLAKTLSKIRSGDGFSYTQLSDATNISKSKIYNYCQALNDMDLVDISDGKHFGVFASKCVRAKKRR